MYYSITQQIAYVKAIIKKLKSNNDKKDCRMYEAILKSIEYAQQSFKKELI